MMTAQYMSETQSTTIDPTWASLPSFALPDRNVFLVDLYPNVTFPDFILQNSHRRLAQRHRRSEQIFQGQGEQKR